MKQVSWKRLRLVSLCLVLGMLFLAAVPAISPAFLAAEVTKNDISQQQAKLNSLSAQADKYREALRKAKSEEASLVDQLKSFDNLMITYESVTETAAALIAQYDQTIDELSQKITESQAEYDRKYGYFKERLRASREEGNISTLQLIFNAGSFLEMLESLERTGDLLDYDTQIMRELEDQTTQLEADRKQLDALRADEKQTLETYSVLSESLKKDIEETEAEIEVLKKSISENEEAKKYYEDLEEEAEKTLDAIYDTYFAQQAAKRAAEEKKRLEEEKKRAQEQQQQQQQSDKKTDTDKDTNKNTGGKGMWPLPSSFTLITSSYGYRNHPISGKYKFHKGTDIYAPKGTAIYATLGGTVIYSGRGASYGHYIIIDHGNGVSTLYAHCSARLVSTGDTVKKGQTIGKVGMTGSATGYHLHFEWRIDGEPVNAMSHVNKP